MSCRLLISLAIAGALAACTTHDDAAPEERTDTYAFVSNGIDPYWTIAEAGVDAAGRDLGVDVSMHKPAGGIDTQKRILEDLITRRVNGIAVSPIDSANQIEQINDIATRIPLVTADSDAPDSERLCFIGVDNYVAGRMAGGLLREALPNGGEIAIFVGRLEQDNAARRRAGVIDELLGREADDSRVEPADEVIEGNGFRIVGTLTDQFDMMQSKANMEDTLSRHPKLAGAVGLFAYNAPAILEAVRQAGKVGDVAIVGFDERAETLAGVANGAIHGTVVQNPYMYGYRAIEILHAVKQGDRSELPADGFIRIPARAIRKADVAAFSAEMQTLLGS